MKKIAFLLSFMIAFFCAFSFVGCSTNNYLITTVSFIITNQLGEPIENATISFKKLNKEIITNQNGENSITIKLPNEKEKWIGTILTIKAEGYVPIIIFNFILQYNEPRSAQFMLLFDDGTLPYCTYVEIPENDEIKRILLK